MGYGLWFRDQDLGLGLELQSGLGFKVWVRG